MVRFNLFFVFTSNKKFYVIVSDLSLSVSERISNILFCSLAFYINTLYVIFKLLCVVTR